MKKIFLALFVLVSIGEMLSTLIETPLLHIICKPAILLSLIGYYISTMRQSGEVISRSLLLALVLSWAGDVLLMRTGELFFMLGLVGFLLAHIFYILTFRQHRNEDETHALQGLQRVRFAFPVVFSGSGLAVILYPHLGELKLPVLVYALVLTLMVLGALFRFGRTNTASFAMVFGGGILFMISDSLLAINKFLEPVGLGTFWIMLTYISAQFLMVRGLIRHA